MGLDVDMTALVAPPRASGQDRLQGDATPMSTRRRPRLTAIAVRILGSKADADDVLQEAWLRLSRTQGVDDVPAWLTTVVTRLCLDHLRKRRTRTEAEAGTTADPAPVACLYLVT